MRGFRTVDKKKINKQVFAKGIARVFMDLKSSHCYFIFQVAFGEDKTWEDVEEICNKIMGKKQVKR